jgi:rod shape-determining protein MreC
MPALPYEPPPFFKRGPSPFARFVFFTLASLALLFADSRYGYLESVRVSVYSAVEPLQRVALLPGQLWDGVAAYFASQTKLAADNRQLRQQLVTQGAVVQSTQSLRQENERLRGLLDARSRYAGEEVLAEVLYLGRDPFSQKLYVNKGANTRVRAGQAVVDDAGVIGQVTRVYAHVSEVTLLTEKDHTIPVKVQRNGVRTLLVGAGTGHLPELRFMAANADIQSGDVLVTSGLDGTYPPGLAVAAVAAVERDSGLMFARITCRPLAGVDRSDQVLIVPAPAANTPPRPEEAQDGTDASNAAAKRPGKQRRLRG